MKFPAHSILPCVLVLAGPLVAQEHNAAHHDGASPYVGEEQRGIKALSDDDLKNLRAGRGMGLAKAAELNGYPGPMHALELAQQLDLTERQKAELETAMQKMRERAVALGNEIVAREQELDELFASRRATTPEMERLTRLIGERQAELRATHLRAHLATTSVMNPMQVRRYAELRGYAASAAPAK